MDSATEFYFFDPLEIRQDPKTLAIPTVLFLYTGIWYSLDYHFLLIQSFFLLETIVLIRWFL